MDRGRGQMTLREFKVSLGVASISAPKTKLDVALAWWRNYHQKASVPFEIRQQLSRRFGDKVLED